MLNGKITPKSTKTALYDFFVNVKQIIRLFEGHKWQVLIAVIFALAATVFSVWGPKILSIVIDTVVYGLQAKVAGNGNIDINALITNLIILSLVYISGAAFQVIHRIICTNVSRKVCYDLRNRLADKITKLPMGYFESNSKGNLLSRVINDVDSLGESIAEVFISIVTTITMLVGSVIMMLMINVTLTAIILVLVPLSLALVLLILRYSQQHFVNQRNNLGEVNGYIEEYVKGHQLVQAYNKQKETVNNFNILNEKLFREGLISTIISSISTPLINFVSKISYVVVVMVGAYFSIVGIMTVGQIQAFLNYVNNFTGPLASLMGLFNAVQSMAASAQRIYEFLETPNEENPEISLPENIDKKSDAPVISFKNIDFSYDGKKNIINNFSLDVYRGQTIAIVGPTGAGKTTLIKLLMRFYDVNAGKIELYGHDIKKYNRESIRQNFAMVLQDIWLFHGSISENIKYGKLEATAKEIEAAAKFACADTFINKLAKKFESIVTEGAKNFSQGQNQLISIARAIIAGREIMILDEATSSVDTSTEQKLYEAFDKVIEEKTSIVIAHRLSTIKNADIILVLNNGDVIEQGNHESLLEQKGFYYDLYKSGIS